MGDPEAPVEIITSKGVAWLFKKVKPLTNADLVPPGPYTVVGEVEVRVFVSSTLMLVAIDLEKGSWNEMMAHVWFCKLDMEPLEVTLCETPVSCLAGVWRQ